MTDFSENTSLSFDERLVNAQPYMMGFALKLKKGNKSKAEDLVNEVNVRALKKKNTFQGRCKLETWLIKLMLHQQYDETHRQHRMEPDSLVREDGGMQDIAVSSRIEEGLYAASVIELLDRLPLKQKEALLLIVQGQNTKDGALIANCPENTFKNLVFRGRKNLRALIEKPIPASQTRSCRMDASL